MAENNHPDNQHKTRPAGREEQLQNAADRHNLSGVGRERYIAMMRRHLGAVPRYKGMKRGR